MASTKLTKPQAVLFDWDNTLVDSWNICLIAVNKVFRHFSFPELTLEEIKAKPQKSLRDTFPEYFGKHWREAENIYYSAYKQIHLERLSPLEKSADLIQQLWERNIYLAVVSNKHRQNLRTEIKHLGWNKYFSNVVGSMDADFDKPDIAPVKLALSKSNCQLGPHVWFVGDSEVDMICAKNAGITGIYVGPEEQELQARQAHPELTAYKTLAELYQEIICQ